MLFDAMRLQVANLTEVGLLFGNSLPVWHGYFPNAKIWGLDIAPSQRALATAQRLGSRVKIMPPANSQDPATLSRLGLTKGSMDIVIDDGDHRPAGMMRTLVALCKCGSDDLPLARSEA